MHVNVALERPVFQPSSYENLPHLSNTAEDIDVLW